MLQETYRLLSQARTTKTLREISEASGVNFHWLGKFAQQAYAEPSVVKVERLHQYLSAISSDAKAA